MKALIKASSVSSIADPKYVIFEGELATVYTDGDIPPQELEVISVKKAQFKIALLRLGYLASVQNAVNNSTNDELKILWTDQDEFWSNNALVIKMGLDLGLTLEQIRGVFILAATIQP